MTPGADEGGVGCRPALLAVVGTVLLAAGTFAVGLLLTLDEGCTGGCEAAGIALYAAGAPVSGLFSALAGGLPVAWPVDLILWIVAGVLAAGFLERRARPAWQAPFGLLALGLLWGAVVSTLVERA